MNKCLNLDRNLFFDNCAALTQIEPDWGLEAVKFPSALKHDELIDYAARSTAAFKPRFTKTVVWRSESTPPHSVHAIESNRNWHLSYKIYFKMAFLLSSRLNMLRWFYIYIMINVHD